MKSIRALPPVSDPLGHLARQIKYTQTTPFKLLWEIHFVHFLVTFKEVYVKGQSSCLLCGTKRGKDSGAAVLKVGLTLSDGGKIKKKIPLLVQLGSCL